MESCAIAKDTILDTHTEARPIYIPSVIVGYFGDLILAAASASASASAAKVSPSVKTTTSQKDSR